MWITSHSHVGLNSMPGAIPVSGGTFSGGLGPIFLDELTCRGEEASLLQCISNPIGVHNCDHSEDAGVRCEGVCTTVYCLS